MPVRYEREQHVALITLDRPAAHNAIDLEMWQAFSDATARLETDEDAWVGIITGEGEQAFCAGADIGATVERLMDDPHANPYDAPPTIMRGQSVTKPLIAAINGLAVGGGMEIVLACDLRIAARHARLALPEVGIGLIPGWGGTQRLPRQVTWPVAARMILGGEMLTADEALANGLLNAVVEPGALLDDARTLAALLCARGPVALRAAKRAMLEGASLPFEDGLALEARLFDALAYTADVREGLAAFRERRPPQFTGR